MNKNSLHIFPFYSKYTGIIKTEFCDLSEDNIEIRGLPLTKVKLDDDVPFFLNDKKIKENIFYWKIDYTKIDNAEKEITNNYKNNTSKKCDVFEQGLLLTRKGIGF